MGKGSGSEGSLTMNDLCKMIIKMQDLGVPVPLTSKGGVAFRPSCVSLCYQTLRCLIVKGWCSIAAIMCSCILVATPFLQPCLVLGFTIHRSIKAIHN